MPLKSFLEHGTLAYSIVTIIFKKCTKPHLFVIQIPNWILIQSCTLLYSIQTCFSELIFFTSTNETFLEKNQLEFAQDITLQICSQTYTTERIECLSLLYLENVSDTWNSVKQTGVTSLTSISVYLKLEIKPLERIALKKKKSNQTNKQTTKNYFILSTQRMYNIVTLISHFLVINCCCKCIFTVYHLQWQKHF